MQATQFRKPSVDRPLHARPMEEGLVADARAGLTPSQMVERKLIGLLRGTALPVSHLLTATTRRHHS